MTDKDMTLKVFDIQRFSIHDGPGIRTTVFLSGCPLRCPWCSNPESQSGRKELMYFSNKCVHCGRCMAACPHHAISFSSASGPSFDRSLCEKCGSCVQACLSDALKLSGKEMTVQEIVDIVKRDVDYYRGTGGGVTVSGGEPLLQPDGLAALLSTLNDMGFSTAIETTGAVPEKNLRTVLGLVDLFLFDLKHNDVEALRQTVGGELKGILHNLKLAAETGNVIVRVPVIPGFNFSGQVLKGIVSLAAESGVKTIDLLPYHVLGKSKYAQLGLDYPMGEEKALPNEALLPFAEYGKELGIQMLISGKQAANYNQEVHPL